MGRGAYVAECKLLLDFDVTACQDAADDLEALRRALAHHHGAPYRELDRALEQLEHHPQAPLMTDLGQGHIMISPPPAWAAVLARARRLGVL
jgi:hypothetical protein